ncbi:uncharacterized protein TM35_000451360 [Trypanosoma theileri]|uniref:Mucin TcMUCII n=1 Tax=Trypanosoma theileri TaxID=67003 RepID=A0A1X0NIP8_9TRYP|nr:uncharacterized protein TM35_000451360 [Trypanosoma theileri]ORC84398.1 hypothetical protein TM35_000451360 [Trypanosoma theileri]
MVMMRYVLCILALLLSCACVHVLAEEVPAADLSDQVPDTESETKICLDGTPGCPHGPGGSAVVPAPAAPPSTPAAQCTPGTWNSSCHNTSNKNVFTTLFGEDALKSPSDSPDKGSPTCKKRVEPATHNSDEHQRTVTLAQDGGGAGEPTLSTNKETSLQRGQNQEKDKDKEKKQADVLLSAQEVKGSVSPQQEVAPEGPVSAHNGAGRNAESTSTTRRQTQGSSPPTKGDAAPHGDHGTPSNTSDETETGEQKPNQPSSPTAESAAPIDGNSVDHSTATPGTTAISGSEEANTTTPPITENTTTEAPTTTQSRDSNLTTQSTATDDVATVPNSPETNSTTLPSPESTVSEESTTTPSPVPNAEISTIASTVQTKANVDSSVGPVWMRTAAPLLIMAVLFSVTVY